MVNAAMWRVLSETYSLGRDIIFGNENMNYSLDFESANEKESFYHAYPTLSPVAFPARPTYSANGDTSSRPHMEDIVAPFFLVASILLSLALLYSILFLCLLRFGDFSDSDNEGRIYLCGRRFYIPFFWFLRLYLREGSNGARSIVGNVPRHFMTREERTTAILELLDGTFVTIDQAEVTRLRALAEVRRIEEEGGILPILDEDEPSSERKNAAVPEDGRSGASEGTVAVIGEKPVEGHKIVRSMEAEETKEEIETPADSHEYINNDDDVPGVTIENIKELVVEGSNSSKTVRFAPTESEESKDEVTDTTDEGHLSPEYIMDNDSIPNLGSRDSTLGASFESTSEEIVCSICLEEYEVGDICVAPNSCNHRFHKECTMSWLNRKNNSGCPYCRRDIVDNAEVWTIVQRLRHERNRNIWKQRRNRASTMLKRFTPQWKRQRQRQHSSQTTSNSISCRHGGTNIVREDTAAPNQHPSSQPPHRTNYMDLEMGEA